MEGRLTGMCHVQTEKHMLDMVVAAALTARVDQPAGIVRSAARQQPGMMLNG